MMNIDINVSIITPHYNSPLCLEKLLLSIPDREDIQIIVVDDNSTKELEELQRVRDTYKDRVEFYRNDTGVQSAGACRNIGIDKAKGKWILFADADDYFFPEMYSLISRYFDSDYDMVIFCPSSVKQESGEPATRHYKHEERIRTYLKDPTRDHYLALDRTTTIWSKLIRRSVMTENQIYCRTSLHGNDFVCSQKLFYYCRNKLVTEDRIYCVTQSSTSLTAKKTDTSFENSVKERTEGFLFNREHYSMEDVKRIDLSGMESLLNGLRKKIGFKKLIWGYRYFKKHGVYIIPKRLKNPKNLIAYIKKGYLV